MSMVKGHAMGLVILSAVLCTLATFVIVARCVIRCFVLRNFWWDDLAIVAAVAFTLGYLAEFIFLNRVGLGCDTSDLTAEMMVVILKCTVAVQITYYVAVGLIKASILLLYLRFVVCGTLRKLCYGTLVFEVLFSIVCIIVVLVQCVPLDKAWDITHSTPGTCINTTALFYATASLNIITDIWIMALPVKALKGTNRPRRELVTLCLVFGAGLLAIIVSVVRLNSIYRFAHSTSPFRDAILLHMWSITELTVAIVCASVPPLNLLISPQRLRQAMHKKRRKHRGPGASSSGRSYFSDQEHNDFVKERMAKLPATLITAETVSLTEVTVAADPSWITMPGRCLVKGPHSPGSVTSGDDGAASPKYEDGEGYGFDWRQPANQRWSVRSFCYAGEVPEQKNGTGAPSCPA